ncbi:hypothetical protein B0H10DRAFT_2109001, partial [Mycena sp. CBHHK59/15]
MYKNVQLYPQMFPWLFPYEPLVLTPPGSMSLRMDMKLLVNTRGIFGLTRTHPRCPQKQS